MSHRIIRSLYEQRLATWAAARSLPVAWENVPFTPPAGVYLRAYLRKSQTDSQDLAGKHRVYAGVFQISVFGPKGIGSGQAGTLAEDIAALFPLNLQLTRDGLTVQIVAPCSEGSTSSSDTHHMIPVWFTYRADTI